MFKDFITSFSKESVLDKIFQTIFEPKGESSWDHYGEKRILFNALSDSIILTFPLNLHNGLLPLKSIYGVFSACASGMLLSLNSEFAVRGAIEIGPCIYDSASNEVYGSALSDAVKYEKDANWPRILVGPELVKYLDDCRNLPPGPNVNPLNIGTAELCLSGLTKDEDGSYFLDYLSGVYFEHTDPKEYKSMIDKAASFIQRQIERFRDKPTIHQKYLKLQEYFSKNNKSDKTITRNPAGCSVERTNKLTDTQFVEDVIVPVIAIPEDDPDSFRFLGTGFFIDKKGHLVTCRHVVEDIGENENLFAYQFSTDQYFKLDILRSSPKYDISLCKSDSPMLKQFWVFFDESFIDMGSNVEVYGYAYEPVGSNDIPFRQRYLKGYITGFSREDSYPDSYELSFPVLAGMSGSPLVCHIPFEGEDRPRTGIIGCVYGSRESEIVRHTVVKEDNYEERVSKVYELGMAYKIQSLFSLFSGFDLDIYVTTKKNF